MSDRERYIKEHFDEKFRVWFRKVCVLTSAYLVLSSGLDLIRQPGSFQEMLLHRLPAVAVLLFAAYALKKLDAKSVALHYAAAFAVILFSAAEAEHRIMLTGGGASPYFLEHIMIGVLFVGYVPGSMRFWTALAAVICLVYAVPLMLSGAAGRAEGVAFKTAYLALAYAVLLYMRLLRNRAVLRQLALRYEIYGDKAPPPEAV